MPLADEVEEPDIDGEPLVPGDAGYQDLTPGGVHRRVDRLEQALTELTTEMRKLGAAKSAPKKKATAKAPSSKSRPLKPRPGAGSSPVPPHNPYPMLDAGVVHAALQAGIPEENLQQMQKLVSRGSKAMKVKDMNPMVQPADFLSEDEVIEGDNAEDQEGDGSADQGPLAASLSKLTAIVDLLTSEKLKRASTSKLEVALDSGAGSSSDLPLQGTRQEGRSCEKGIAEFLRGASGGHLSFDRAAHERGLERGHHRSWHGSTSALRTGVGGIQEPDWGLQDRSLCSLECSRDLGLTHAGSCEKGEGKSFSLPVDVGPGKHRSRELGPCRGVLALEAPPPFASLANHQLPAVQDGESPFSKLLDPRWSELAMAHLKDQVKRKNVGKFNRGGREGAADEAGDADTKRKPKPKAKPKSQSSGSQQDR